MTVQLSRVDANLRRMLYPDTVAVLGASADVRKHGGQVLASLRLGQDAIRIYPVNPGRGEINGLKCFPDLASIPEAVDHCVIGLPASSVPEALRQCANAGVGGATIIAAGLGEGAGGGGLGDQSVPYLGPNCFGFVNVHRRVFAAPRVGTMLAGFPAGSVSVVSQSAGLGMKTFGYLAGRSGVGLNFVVSLGNAAGVPIGDLVQTVLRDDNTEKLLMLVESDALLGEVLRSLDAQPTSKGLYLLKLGRTELGGAMVASHTGSLAQSGPMSRDCAEQAGFVCLDDLDETIAALQLPRRLSAHRSPGAPQTARVAAVSVSGGSLALLADAAADNGLEFPQPSPQAANRISSLLPPYATVANPLDITGSFGTNMNTQRAAVEALLEDPAYDAVIVSMTSTEAEYQQVLDVAADLGPRYPGRLIILWIGGAGHDFGDGRDALRRAGVPIVTFAGVLSRSLAAIVRAPLPGAGAGRHPAAPPPGGQKLAVSIRNGAVTESEAMELLHSWNISTPRLRRTKAAASGSAAQELGFPVVVKRDSDTTHIARSGGVVVGLRSLRDIEERVLAVFDPDEPVIVAEFLPGIELIVSVFEHKAFGRLLMLGSGGVDTELQADVSFARLPAQPERIKQLLRRIPKLRAAMAHDISVAGTAAGFVGRVSDVGARLPQGWQLELNPVTVGAHGAAAVDAALTWLGQETGAKAAE